MWYGECNQYGGNSGESCKKNCKTLCRQQRDCYDPPRCRICLPGPVGMTGATGPIGEMGPMGATGIQGVAGEMGPMGVTGPRGNTGEKGEMGATGTQGATGVMGPMGMTGPRGSTAEIPTQQFLSLGSLNVQEVIGHTQEPWTFSTVLASNGIDIIGGTSSPEIILVGLHSYFIAYTMKVNLTQQPGSMAFSSLSVGLLLDGHGLEASFSSVSGFSLQSVAGSIIVQVTRAESILEVATISGGSVNVIDASISILQLI